MQLLFIRHAQSVGNQSGRMQGDSDAPLSVMGQQQAEALGSYLRKHSWKPSHLYTSPLRRAIETAERLLDSLIMPDPESMSVSDLNGPNYEPNHESIWASAFSKLDPEMKTDLQPDAEAQSNPEANEPAIYPDQNLREQGLGILENLTWAEAQAQFPDLCQQLESNRGWLPIPGAETLQEGRSRAVAFVQKILEQHRDCDRLWIVSHSGILQHLISVLLGSDRTWGLTIPNGGLFEFTIALPQWQTEDQNRWNGTLWQIHRFNETPVYAKKSR